MRKTDLRPEEEESARRTQAYAWHLYTQWLKLKVNYMGVIMLARYGEWWEAFDGDAVSIGTFTDVIVDRWDPVDASMKKILRQVGIPVEHVNRYACTLAEAGWIVAMVTPKSFETAEWVRPGVIQRQRRGGIRRWCTSEPAVWRWPAPMCLYA